MKEIARTPILEDKTSTGKAKFWFCKVVVKEAGHFLVSESWTVNESGEESVRLISEPAQVFGKNQGKANETTDEEQAIFDMGVKLRKKQDKGYHEVGKVVEREFTLPMLAHKYKDKKHTVKFPCTIQPKFNGIRCLYDGKKFWSRGGKELLPEVMEHLHFDTKGLKIDGELILPDPYTFQETISAIKKFRPESRKLLYRVYDLAMEGVPQVERLLKLEKLIEGLRDGKFNMNLILAESHIIRSHEEIKPWHDKFVAAGFEGAMLRLQDGEYTPGHRSSGLLKYKEMQDDEFEITGFKEGKGSAKGSIIFECKTKEGKTFDVLPEGSVENRQDLFKKGESLIGKMYTVRFQVYTDDGIPYFPVGVGVRDYE